MQYYKRLVLCYIKYIQEKKQHNSAQQPYHEHKKVKYISYVMVEFYRIIAN